MTIQDSLFRLDGDVALMCGVGGIGHTVARGLAEYGVRLMVADLKVEAAEKTAAAIRAQNYEVAHIVVDVTDEASVEAGVQATVKGFGRLDILVNTVGFNSYASALDMPGELWRRTVDVNLTGAFLLARGAARQMMKGGGGRIVNFISISSLVGSPTLAPYAAAKAGLVSLTKTLALEWSKYSIRVNAVSPAMTETPMNTEWLRSTPGRVEETARRIPAGRLGTPDDFVGPVVFLVSKAAQFVLGQTLIVDGGTMVQHPLVTPVTREN